MLRTFSLLLLFSLSLFGGTATIRDINIKDKGDKIDLVITFSSQYDGMVTRKSGQAIQKIIFNGATLSRKFSRTIDDNPLISKIDILPFDGKVDLLLSTTKDRDISYSQSNDGLMIIVTITESLAPDKVESDEVSPNGQSAVNMTSPKYWLTIFGLIAVFSLVFIFKKQFVKFLTSYKNKSNYDQDNVDIRPTYTSNPSQNAQHQHINNKVNERNEPKITSTIKSQTELNSSLHKIQAPPIKLPVRKNPNSFPSQTDNSEVIFDERTSVGRVFAIKIGDIQHVVLENENGMSMIKLWSEKVVKQQITEMSESNNIDNINVSYQESNNIKNDTKEKNEFDKNSEVTQSNHNFAVDNKNDISELFSDSKIKLL